MFPILVVTGLVAAGWFRGVPSYLSSTGMLFGSIGGFGAAIGAVFVIVGMLYGVMGLFVGLGFWGIEKATTRLLLGSQKAGALGRPLRRAHMIGAFVAACLLVVPLNLALPLPFVIWFALFSLAFIPHLVMTWRAWKPEPVTWQRRRRDLVVGVCFATLVMLGSGEASILVLRHANVATPANAARDDLFWTSRVGDVSRVEALLAANADVNAKDQFGRSALMLASQSGQLEVVQALLAAKADVNAKAGNGATALILASVFGHLDVVRTLLGAKADVNARASDGATALMLASQNGHLGVVQALLGANADVNARRDDGETALSLATERNFPAIAQLLKAPHSSPNK